MPIDRDVLEAVREMDEHELRRLLILAKARLEQRGISFPAAGPDVKLRAQHVKCGKTNCARCPHGPYWYAYWWEDGRRRSRYVGKLDDLEPSGEQAGFSRGVSVLEALPSAHDG
jgi:hypothetical protein